MILPGLLSGTEACLQQVLVLDRGEQLTWPGSQSTATLWFTWTKSGYTYNMLSFLRMVPAVRLSLPETILRGVFLWNCIEYPIFSSDDDPFSLIFLVIRNACSATGTPLVTEYRQFGRWLTIDKGVFANYFIITNCLRMVTSLSVGIQCVYRCLRISSCISL